MLIVSTQPRRWLTASAPALWPKGRFTRTPNADRALHAHHIAKPERCDAGAKTRVGPIAGVGEHYALRRAGGVRALNLVECDLWLGLKDDFLWNAGFLAARAIVGPRFGQIQSMRNRQAGRIIGDRKRHRDLAIVLLAQLAAILPPHAN